MVTKELCTEIERLGRNLGHEEIGNKLGMSKYAVSQLIKQYRIPYKNKTATQSVRRRLTKKIFEARVRKNYRKCKRAGPADVWVRQSNGRLIPVMKKGKLEDTEFARNWWKAKIDKAWKRRSVFSLGYTEEVE